jgi:microsomal epoxide hydrolase
MSSAVKVMAAGRLQYPTLIRYEELMNTKTEGFVESQGIKIHYLARNLDDTKLPAMLFVPGVMMPAWIWEKQLEYFSKKYRVVAMDPRSQGDSEQATEGHYAFSLAKDIKAVVDTLKLQPLVLIGWSLAVPEVVNYAAHFGSKELKGLVLVDGLVGIDPTVSFYKSTVDFWGELQSDRIPKTREFVKVIFKQPQPEAYFEKLFQSAMRTPTNTAMTLVDNYLLQDFRPLLSKIQTPTLVVTVEGPRLDYMKTIEKKLPHSQFEVIKSAGHALFVDQPDRFNQLLEQFIALSGSGLTV